MNHGDLISVLCFFSFREVPTFGRDTIRRFSSNVSELKKLAARDFEDLLQVSAGGLLFKGYTHLFIDRQCSIPVFDGLLPEPYNEAVLRLLFLAAHWHSLAKLRMHTDQTLDIFDSVTSVVGEEFREFNDKTCPHFRTRELPRERDARKRRLAKKSHSRQGSSQAVRSDQDIASSAADIPLLKSLSIDTYKHHSVGDYPRIIRTYGTTDSYSTEPVS